MKQFPAHIAAVDGIIFNESGEILLVKNYNGLYSVPGGQVEIGENLEVALKREILEETGTTAEVEKLICVSSNTGTYMGYGLYEGVTVPTKIMFGFVCRYTGGELRTSNETSEVLWVPLEKVKEYITAPPLVERFDAYFNKSGGITYLEYITKPEYKLLFKRTF